MTRLQLKVQQRKLLGKKVKRLRQQGIIPANIYGKKIKSLAIQVEYPAFVQVWRKAGETAIVDLFVDQGKTPHHTLIRNIQRHPVTDRIIHVDFMQVDLKEKIEAAVPIKLVGEPKPVQEKQALLMQELDELTIEAPADKLPEKIEVDVSKLQAVGDTIKVKDLRVTGGVEVKTDPGQIVAHLVEAVTKEAEELAQEEQAQAEAQKEAAEEATPAAPTQPEQPQEQQQTAKQDQSTT